MGCNTKAKGKGNHDAGETKMQVRGNNSWRARETELRLGCKLMQYDPGVGQSASRRLDGNTSKIVVHLLGRC